MNQNPLLKFWQIIKSPSHSRTLGILAILVMVAAIPLTVYIAQQRQEVRQRAAEAPPAPTCKNFDPADTACPYRMPGDGSCLNGRTDLLWKANCGGSSCTTNTQCPKNTWDPSSIKAADSNWCMGFDGPSKSDADWRCMVLVRRDCQTGTEPACEPTLSVTTLSANPAGPAKSTATTITANGQGNPIKVYISSVSPQGANPPLVSGGAYSSGMTFDPKKYYSIGSTNPVAQPPTTTIQITSPSIVGAYFLFANAYDKEPPTKTCSWDKVRYDLTTNPITNKGACTNAGVVPFTVGEGTTGGTGKPWVGGKVTNSKDNTKGIKDVEIQVYNNDAPGTGSAKIKTVLTDANGAWHVEDFVDWGNTYAVWVTGNLANPKTAPSGFTPPAKTTTLGWTWDFCAKNSPGGVEEGDTLVGSLSYECQKAEQNNRKDCSGPAGNTAGDTTLRCNFAYDPAPFPDAKIQFNNEDLQVRSKNISAGQTVSFKATIHANQGTLSLGEIWVAKKDGSAPDFCPGQTNGKWCAIKAEIITDGTTTKPITGSWVSKVTTSPGEYWAAVNAKDNLGGKCSGNPLDPLPSGWSKCDPDNLDRLTIIVGAGATGSPTGTATQPPPSGTQPPSPTLTPSPSPTFTPGGTQLAFELILQGVGPEGGNQNPRKPQRQLRVQIFNDNNQEVANKSGDINFDQQSQAFKGTIDLGVIQQSNSNKFVIKVKTKRYLRKLIDGITTLNLGTVNQMPLTTMIVGDINDDNKLNIEDYNILVGCFAGKADTSSCTDKENADLDDNDVIDGIDLNLFLRSLSVQEGD